MPINPNSFRKVLFEIEKKHMQELDDSKEQKIHDPVVHINLLRIIHKVNAFRVVFVLTDKLTVSLLSLFSNVDLVQHIYLIKKPWIQPKIVYDVYLLCEVKHCSRVVNPVELIVPNIIKQQTRKLRHEWDKPC